MKRKKISKFRFIVQIFFVVLILYLSVGHYLSEKQIAELPGIASLHAVCPFGGVVNLYTFFTTGNYVQKLHQSDFIMLIALLITLIIGGAFFCGWICPLGSVQEWFGKIGKKIFKQKYNRVPKKIDRLLRYFKYFVLAWVIFQTARSSTLVFQNIDPYYNLFNIWTDEIALSGYISVAITLFLSLFIERPFCRYACPLGAVNGLFNKISFFNIKRDEKSCVNCNLCNKSCPSGIQISDKNYIKDTSCIRCMECTESCPVNDKKENTLKMTFIINNKKKLNSFILPVILLVIFIGTIIFTYINGSFITERIRVFNTTEDIRGSVTIQEIIDNFDIEKNILYKAFGISGNIESETKLKDIQLKMGIDEYYEIISTEKIREFTKFYNMPLSEYFSYYNINSENLNISDSDNILLKDFVLSSEKGIIPLILDNYKVSEYSEDIPEEEHKDLSSVNIKGNSTLYDIKDQVNNFEEFLKNFGITENISLSTTVKELRDLYGIEITDIKEYILK